jgi:glycosyltransferase involved in cell wall biosynthesis
LAHILVVGSGTQFKKLENWFNLKKPPNATLLSGLPRNEYDALLAACDIGMIFLHKDFTIPNFPSRLLAYLEMKKPVLAATDVNTDIGKVIENAECGYWVEAGDIEDMQNKISKLCEEGLNILGENSWELLQKDYLVERSYKLLIDKLDV